MKTAIVYDRVNKWGGAEQVLLALHEIFPKAPLYTSVYNKKTAKWAEVFPQIHTSFLQNIPFAKTNHEYFAPLMPLVFESFNFDEFDLVITVTSEAAKGIITKPKTKHICYCLTPTRYLWSGYGQYFKGATFKGVAAPLIKYFRKWDKVAGQRPDHMIAISTAVQKRIKKYYGRESEINYPPVDIEKFQISNNKIQTNSKLQITKPKQQEYYLIVSRLVSYKKVDLVVEAFNDLGKRLIVVGTGRQQGYLKRIAKDNIEFRGFVDGEELVSLYQNAKAFIYPQEEDFGITAVEAQAAGVPVIAYKKGGAIDTVLDSKTGIFFTPQTVDRLVKAVKKLDKIEFDQSDIIKNVNRFSKEIFRENFRKYIDKVMKSS